MAAPILEVDMEHPSPRHIQRAVEVLERGGLIAYPTDTYYGMGCDLGSKRAIERLYQLKGRDKKKPLSFLCPDLSDVARYAHVSNFAYRTMKGLTPGAFTFVLEATRLVPDLMMTKQKQVGIRVPDAPLARELARALGRPLVTTSVSNTQGEPLTDAREIKEEFGHGLELILDGGVTLNEPSTVVSLIGDTLEILRQGKGRLED
ncbi:threonylcarbamoyl-AMP synthase [Myxococcus sp. CA051A]|uniref:Threonylcarbamoyl-AMP synthase n=1 Tax=Myxococcus llanfairpwllgwyngyllgogerychwyrndrobwllllantysiliogogogochensis TaxID=2590453 RepID=A0A540WHV5_9BACT|nr:MULTISPECIES: L-threonylcarbamoyladenylate synthase [Myxococcus]NTX02523.1 threonylcarbamoyl-AMP synthase [Myxococcus sp. CA040A]NTX16981.1 threonylcarbamoyl-AMP synthase [Myxococcus sp. CA056]NTX36629.1 threonylcarbamoyl-AMP synthase [Myxococcus sp. CA033]NTX58793.1 threonylcarbamoyl-AMP synthase [Myxococcus sp. CA039A]NTX66261.1 threonylcarbamoyl-AMP synthase [Myxococcus sp. CA051A]